MTLLDDIRQYWDDDAATYDNSPGHHPTSAAVQAAWTAALAKLLPPAPSRVLDCGAGTGFLSLIAARLGHAVTALDLSPHMLARLQAAADDEELDITVVVGSATAPPTAAANGFDAVMERHLLWTLPDPESALRAWRAAAPTGRLVVVESMWGDVDVIERVRSSARQFLRRLRAEAPDHHAPYSTNVRNALPLGSGTHPRNIVDLLGRTGWSRLSLYRLRDIEWATSLEMRVPERIIGVTPRFAVTAT